MQDKFKWPICCCQIISRECCNLPWIHLNLVLIHLYLLMLISAGVQTILKKF